MKNLPVIHSKKSVREAMKVINEHGLGIVFIIDEKKRLKGIATDGDIRRAILNGTSINTPIENIMNKKPIKIYKNWGKEKIVKFINKLKKDRKIPKYKSLIVPVLTDEDKVCGVRIIETEIDKEEISFSSSIHKLKKPKRILVIGGAGYIGSVLVRMLLTRGYYIKVIDNLLYGDSGIKELYKKKNFEFLKGDITNISDLVEAMKNVDSVIHLAAIVGDPASKIKPKETLEINYFSTKIMGEIAKHLGISKFIFASSCSVYGFRKKECTEESSTNPLSLYAETKLLSEKALLELKGDGFCPVILRFATAFGYSPRMRFDLVVNLLIAKAIKEKNITVFGKGKQFRPFIHIKDISRSIIKILEAPNSKVCGEIFNVGSEKMNMNIKSLAMEIKKYVPEARLTFLKEKEDNRSYRVSFKKIKETLNFDTKYSIKHAVNEIKRSFKNGDIKDFHNKIYSNFRSLRDK